MPEITIQVGEELVHNFPEIIFSVIFPENVNHLGKNCDCESPKFKRAKNHFNFPRLTFFYCM